MHVRVFAYELFTDLVAAQAVATHIGGGGPTCLPAEEGKLLWLDGPVDRLVERLVDWRAAKNNSGAALAVSSEGLLVESTLAVIIIDRPGRSVPATAAAKGGTVVAFAKLVAIRLAVPSAALRLVLAAATGQIGGRLEEAVGAGKGLRGNDPANFLALLPIRQLDHPIGSLHVVLQHTEEGTTKGLGHTRAH